MPLPRARDYETVVDAAWDLPLPGLTFDGQRFACPRGVSAEASAKWLAPGVGGDSLLSVRLSVGTFVVGECSRCLCEASLEISDELMYLYYLGSTDLAECDFSRLEDFMPVEVDGWGTTLNVADQVWETLLLLLPKRLLCREDCNGLCPNCGTNLNESRCSCSAEGSFGTLLSMAGLQMEVK
ncbi:MAG: DUF177 domain-containing protein [Synergistaceae bacterium]|nr:DUF177 domain-containing protein [Synergistaceae bacterium]